MDPKTDPKVLLRIQYDALNKGHILKGVFQTFIALANLYIHVTYPSCSLTLLNDLGVRRIYYNTYFIISSSNHHQATHV